LRKKLPEKLKYFIKSVNVITFAANQNLQFMLKHIVLMKSLEKDEVEKQMILNSVSEELESLSETVTAIENMEVGRNISSSDSAYDIALVIDFVDTEALNTYRIHPEHQRVLKYLKSQEIEIAVVDYNF
jgi:hypothetical protein